MKEEIAVFAERANKFELGAKYFAEQEIYDLAAFHVEQALQLYIKFILAKEIGYFPRTHSLTKLFHELGKIEKSFEDFYNRHEIVIKDIEDAYILSRYFPRSYSKAEVEKMLETLTEFKRVFEKWLSKD